MLRIEDDLSTSTALVIDSNPTSRSILISQLRDFGVGTIVQTARLADGRRHLESRTFDVVLCEQHFPNEAQSGQDLLDELRRNHLLPFSTVFIMVTGEATYNKVAEAAESALDGYLLKPHKAAQLGERLRQARIRKLSLQTIFQAIEANQLTLAMELCRQRVDSQGLFWLYCARVGAELMLRTGRYPQAKALYETVYAARGLLWAQLGMARALLDEGQTARAITALEALISADPSYADAYDVMARAQFQQGKYDNALAAYQAAFDLTPASVSRTQHLGMMTYYLGQRVEAEKILDRSTRFGLESKMFDSQALVMMAVARLESNDRKGFQRCRDDFARLIERNPDNERHPRLAATVAVLAALQQQQFAQVRSAIATLSESVRTPDFDFESAANLLMLMSLLAAQSTPSAGEDTVIETLGLRFCTSRALSELLAGLTTTHAPYAERLMATHNTIMGHIEHAMLLSRCGQAQAAADYLLLHGRETLNGKLIETAYLVLNRYATDMTDAQALIEEVNDLRSRFGTNSTRSLLGEKKRQAGGLTLRTGTPAIKAPVRPA